MKNPTIEENQIVEEIDPIIVPNTNPGEEKNPEFKANHNGTIWHEGFSKDDLRQKMVQYAYKLGGMELVTVMECENGNWSISAIGDSGHAFGLCQMNDRYHKDFPSDYKTNWVVQVEYCYQKRKQGTPYYGPDRWIEGQRCKNYIKGRFTIIE